MEIKIRITNYTYNREPVIIEGSWTHVEEILRGLFEDMLRDVAPGDLNLILRKIGDHHGVELEVLDGQMPPPQPHLYPHPLRPKKDDGSWRKR